MAALRRILERLERVLGLGEQVLAELVSPPLEPGALERNHAFRWEVVRGRGRLAAVARPSHFDLDDLVGVDRAVARLVANTEQFVLGLPSNHVLLHGERGTGKSSAVRGLLRRFGDSGLRLIEVHKRDLVQLGEVIAALHDAPYRILLFADDLSFDEGERDFRELKAALEGSLESPPENVRIVATSNRRYLIPQRRVENAAVEVDERGEVHVGEALEEKLALADRFGLVLSFTGFDQATYLEIVERYVKKAGVEADPEEVRAEALRWALDRSSRSGRTAKQFVDDLAGRHGLRAARRSGGPGS